MTSKLEKSKKICDEEKISFIVYMIIFPFVQLIICILGVAYISYFESGFHRKITDHHFATGPTSHQKSPDHHFQYRNKIYWAYSAWLDSGANPFWNFCVGVCVGDLSEKIYTEDCAMYLYNWQKNTERLAIRLDLFRQTDFEQTLNHKINSLFLIQLTDKPKIRIPVNQSVIQSKEV